MTTEPTDANGRATYRDIVNAVDKLRDDLMERMDILESRIVLMEQNTGVRYRLISSCDVLMQTLRDEVRENKDDIEGLRKREVAILGGLASFGGITIVGLFIYLLQNHIL